MRALIIVVVAIVVTQLCWILFETLVLQTSLEVVGGSPARLDLTNVDFNHQKQIRISYTLHDKRFFPYNNKFESEYQCRLGEIGSYLSSGDQKIYYDREDFPPAIRNQSGVMDFVTNIHMNGGFKLLVIGDSVAVQFAQGLLESAGVENDATTLFKVDFLPARTAQLVARVTSTNGTTTPINGNVGGVIAAQRITVLLTRRAEQIWPHSTPFTGWPKNKMFSGWLRQDVNKLLSHPFVLQASQQQQTNQSTTSNPNMMIDQNAENAKNVSFDAVLFRIPHGWMKLHEITMSDIEETVELVHELYGATTIIFVLIPFSNNIKNIDEFRSMENLNNEIRKFAKQYNPPSPSHGIQHVLVAELGRFVHDFTKLNAQLMGAYRPKMGAPIAFGTNANHTPQLAENRLDETHDQELLDFEKDPTYLFDRFRFTEHYRPSAAYVCSSNISKDGCIRNSFSHDGMHFCMRSIGGRLFANLACLLGCVYNDDGNDNLREPHNNCSIDSCRSDSTTDENNFTHRSLTKNVQQCASDCNSQFMSFRPVDVNTYGIPQHSSSRRSSFR